MKLRAILFVVFCCIGMNLAASERPRIGLVLAGGGAKGGAHIGVLKALEELRVPIDCIAGTSMGALVGGTYAAGRSAHDIERIVVGNDWSETFTQSSLRDEVPSHQKIKGATFQNRIQLGVTRNGITMPGGLLNTQGIEQMIRELVDFERYVNDFSRLPIPFRAVATNIVDSEMVVLDSGDLASAMRASMAIPGAFEPVRIDQQVLIDGGIVRNLPVDVAREACADVVIAVLLKTDTPLPEDLRGGLAIVSRAIDVVLEDNQAEQWQTLGEQDVGIVVELGQFGSADFQNIGDVIPLGVAAAKAQGEALRQLALDEESYQRWRQRVDDHRRGTPPQFTVANIEVSGLERVNSRYVMQQLNIAQGAVVQASDIGEQASRIYALGAFERVDYELTESERGVRVEFKALEKTWGPNFLEFDLGVYAGSGSDFFYTMRTDYRQTLVNSLGAEWDSAVQFGRDSLIESSFYQPLGSARGLFVEPLISISQSREDFFLEDDRVAIYQERKAVGGVDFGFPVGKAFEARLGYRYGYTELVRDTGDRVLPNFSYDDAGIVVSTTYDSLDSDVLPTRGLYAKVEYHKVDEAFGAELEYKKLEAVVLKPITFGQNTIDVKLGYGDNYGSQIPGNDAFALGGFRSVPGLRVDQLRGLRYWIGSVSYDRQILGQASLFGNAINGGVILTGARMFDVLGEEVDDDRVFSVGVFLTGRTPIGELAVSSGHTDSGHWEVAISIGRPLEEGSLFGRIPF